MADCIHQLRDATRYHGELETRQSPTNAIIDGVEYVVTFTGRPMFISGICLLCGKMIEKQPDGFSITEGSTTFTKVT